MYPDINGTPESQVPTRSYFFSRPHPEGRVVPKPEGDIAVGDLVQDDGAQEGHHPQRGLPDELGDALKASHEYS